MNQAPMASALVAVALAATAGCTRTVVVEKPVTPAAAQQVSALELAQDWPRNEKRGVSFAG